MGEKIEETISVLWKLTKSIQQSEVSLCWKNYWTLGRNSGKFWCFSLGLLLTIPLMPPAQSLWRFCQGKTEHEDQQAAVVEQFTQFGVVIPLPKSNDLGAMRTQRSNGSTSLRLQSWLKQNIFLANQGLHTCIKETREDPSYLYTPSQLWDCMHVQRKLRGAQQNVKAKTDFKTA